MTLAASRAYPPRPLAYVRPGPPRRSGRRPVSRTAGAELRPALRDPLFLLTAGVFGAALLLGGATRQNAIPVMVLELISLPLIAVALWRLRGRRMRELALPLGLLAAMCAIPLLQLIPLPFGLWARLPGHAELAEGLRLAGAAPSALPLSLTPDDTRRSVLALLTPAAVFLGAAACSPGQRGRLTGLVVFAAALSLLLGVLQMAGGPDSPLRFYPTTNEDSAVGVFSNRNHLASFLLMSMPLLAYWLQRLTRERANGTFLTAAAGLALLGLILVGVAITHSRAALFLIVPAIAGSILTVWRRGERKVLNRTTIAVGAVGILALIGALSAIRATLARFAAPAGDDLRFAVWPSVLHTARDFLPFGSGIGSFEPVYRINEPIALIGPRFVNAAHNDYLQLALEGGWAAIVVTAVFLGWLAWRSSKAWRRGGGDQTRLARAATVMAALLAMHSAVDYPARTLAIASVLALVCAILASSRKASVDEVSADAANGPRRG
ncbi:MAG: O-antigen ligase family protein [Parcubacteria group bacterium]